MSMSAGAGGNLLILARTHSQQIKCSRHARNVHPKPKQMHWVVCAAIRAICP